MDSITIESLKCLSKRNESIDEEQDDGKKRYHFESFNSAVLFSNKKIKELRGIFCLHHRNYKPILIDKTGWIYLEFLNCSGKKDESILSNYSLSCYLRINYLLKEIVFKCFNFFVEHFVIIKKGEKGNKKILYLQSDLSNCLVVDGASHIRYEDFEIDNDLCARDDVCKFSLIKTRELAKLLNDRSIIPRTVSEIEIKRSQNCFYYFFRVLSKGQMRLLSNTQYNTRLRADIEIELVPYYPDEEERKTNFESAHVIMGIMSQFLFYLNFFFIDNVYILKTKEKLEIQFNKTEKKSPIAILMLNESMKILDDLDVDTLKNNVSLIKKIKLPCLNEFQLTDEFIHNLNGILIEKKVPDSKYQLELLNKLKLDFNSIENFDTLLPNQEFKLSVKVENCNDGLITVFYDSNFFLHSFCILPGMRINFRNLVKKSPNVYKANMSSNLLVVFDQDFEGLLLDEKKFEECQETTKKISNQKKSLHSYLNEINFIYSNVYLNSNSKFRLETKNSNEKNSDFKLNLLFKNDFSSKKENRIIKLIGQVIKLYDLTLRIKCKDCNLLANSCRCQKSPSNLNRFRIEFSAKFLIDDHSSIVILIYSCSDANFKSKQSNLFSPIGDYLFKILAKYLNEIKMPSIPIQVSTFDRNSSNESQAVLNSNKNVYNILRESLNANEIEQRRKHSNDLIDLENDFSNKRNKANDFFSNGESESESMDDFFETNVKLDIYKTLYDFLLNTFIDKHFIFFVEFDSLNMENEFLEFKSLIRNKLKLSLFKVSDLDQNEQFKSILTFKCYNFFPTETFI